MARSPLSDHVSRWFGRLTGAAPADEVREVPRRILVVVLDGTMASLEAGEETNAGLLMKLCREVGAPVMVHYDPGVQWPNWRATPDVLMGKGTNRKIRRAYGWLASRYRPGDRIFLFGFSRGAFAARSLAGVIDMVGLLRPECATVRNIRTAYRHYQLTPDTDGARAFSQVHCHETVPVQMVGVWDTVAALGLRLPFAWRWAEARHAFHNHRLGRSVRNGFHALAMDETREVYEPVLWRCPKTWPGRVEQMWFSGAHGDIGGQLGGFEAARPLANIPLVWMLEQAEGCGLPLPGGWRHRFFTDPQAPSVGTWRSWGKLFLLRERREIGQDWTEAIHPSVSESPVEQSQERVGVQRAAN